MKKCILPLALAVLIASMLMFTGCSSFVEGFNEGYNGTSETERSTTPSPSTSQSGQESPSPTTSTEGTSTTNSYPDEIIYDDKPIMNWMGARLADLRDVFGSPDFEGVVGEGGAYGFSYEDITFVKRDQGEDINYIWGVPATLTYNGTTLDTNRDKLVSLLGNPEYEDWGDEAYYAMLGIDNCYYMTFGYQEIYSISFELDAPNGKAQSFTIYYSDGGSGNDDEWYDSGFRRTDYFTGLSHTDLLRNPDTYAWSKVYFRALKITQVYEPKLYLAQDIISDKYFLIDDRSNTGSNGTVNSVVAVYGIFSGIEMITWNNGSTDQVPFISADRTFYSFDTPTDLVDFAQGLVENMNADEYGLTRNNQYLGGTRVKINVSVRVTPANKLELRYVQESILYKSSSVRNIDGYSTNLIPSSVIKFSDYGITIPDWDSNGDNPDILVWITGSIVSIERGDAELASMGGLGLPGTLQVTLDLENVELD